MPFDHLLFESLRPGKTLAEDRRSGCLTSADVERNGGETVLLFGLDDDSTRKRLGLSDRRCCDFMYFLKNRNQSLLVFVELKSTNIESAAEQIANAHHAIRQHSAFVKSRATRARAVIVSSLGTPRDGKAIQQRMRKRGIDLYFGTSRKGHPCLIKDTIGYLSA
jgi:hypothetical protein